MNEWAHWIFQMAMAFALGWLAGSWSTYKMCEKYQNKAIASLKKANKIIAENYESALGGKAE